MPELLFYEQEVRGIVMNPGEDMFLAVFKDNKLQLYSKSEKQPKIVFEQQQQPVTQVQWLDNVSGDFVSIYANLGVLRIWNAAQASPKQMIKVSPFGILSIHPVTNGNFLLQIASGGIEMFNIRKAKTVLKLDVAHTA